MGCEAKKNDSPTTLVTKTFTLTFDPQGGTEVSQQIIKSGEKAQKPVTPTRDRYIFENWYKENDLKNIFDFTKETIVANMTIYAKWEKQKYTVAFDTNGGNSIIPVEVEQGAKISSPDNPIRPNYVFKGWYEDKNLTTPFDFDKTLITSAITIYTKWIPYIQITENYLGIHSVHFDITVNDIIAKETFGFIIAPATAPVPTATETTSKDGYITRTFSPTQTTRSVFLFAHIATDMAKTFVSDEFQTSASKNDVLSPETDYTLYIYKQNKVVYIHSFTTANFATAIARTPLTIEGLNGGLISTSATPAPLVIEYKVSEFIFFPFSYFSTTANSAVYQFNQTDIIYCDGTQCFSNFRHTVGFTEILSNVRFAGVLQVSNNSNRVTTVSNGSIVRRYNIKLITE